MAEKVTRQFADTDTGTPISGGLFRLVNVTDPTDVPREMVEGTDPEYPGRYSTQAGEDLAPGIWRVERNSGAGYAWTGEEITVSPARMFVGDIDKDNTALTQLQFVVGDCVKATAFVPEDTALGTPLLPYLQDAVNYAATAGLRRVEVGAWKGRFVWSGSAQLDLSGVPGLHLDLKGAEIYRLHTGPSGGATPIKSVGAHFTNGKIAGTGNDNPLVLADDGAGYFKSFFTNIEFGPHTGVTVNDNGWGVTFSNCLGHRLPAVTALTQYQGSQSSDSPCSDENDVAIWPAGLANVDANEIGKFFRHGTLDAAIAPTDTTSPFADGQQMAEALKYLWFTLKPYVGTIPALLTAINAAIDAVDNVRTEDITIPPGEPCYVMVTNTSNPGGISTAQASGFKDVSTRKFPSENGSGNFGVVEADLWIQTPDTAWAGPPEELSTLKEIAIPASVSAAILDGVSFPATAPCEVTATVFTSGATDPKVAYCDGLLTLQAGVLRAIFKPAFIRSSLGAGNAYWRIHLSMKITNTASGMGWN